ncbi:MAG: YbdK family carboxylate-amine ligase [Solirubrobacteraceae bacterium]|nr:YbdK family carboxylate-amine ligase [Solirubrobacteraceae bacterium]
MTAATPDAEQPWTPEGDPSTWLARFATDTPFTIGVEEEVMLLDPATFDLAGATASASVLALLGDDDAYSPELHAAQLEVKTSPGNLAAVIAELGSARERLVGALDGRWRVATAGVHPFADRRPLVSEGERYRRLASEYGRAALEMVTFGLHVHVALDGGERAVAVHDALREHLPTIAALSANGPFHEGVDTGFASLRPRLAEALPRQGVPPAFGDTRGWCDFIRWGQQAGAFGPQELWWEVRLHPAFGTVEVRVADAQADLADVGALVATIAALVVHLSDRFDADDLPAPVAGERIAENRWLALRYGLTGDLLDPRTGEARPAREMVRALLETIAPASARLGDGAAEALERAGHLAACGGAEQQRLVADARGLAGLVSWLADRYEHGGPAPAPLN